jgi:hypothetical protein
VVLPQLDPFKPVPCSFGMRDRMFNFGALLAQLPDASEGGTATDSGGKKSAAKAGRAAAAGRTSTTAANAPTGPTPASIHCGSVLDEPGAVRANLRFTNPVKVPCTVNFAIKPRTGAAPGVLQHCSHLWCYSSGPHNTDQGLVLIKQRVALGVKPASWLASHLISQPPTVHPHIG